MIRTEGQPADDQIMSQVFTKVDEMPRKRRSNKTSCPPGQIRRKGYRRKGYKRDDGTYVDPTYVPPTCIEDRGAPGKGPDVVQITHEGKLGGPGYLKKSAKTRHRLLGRCVSKHGYRSCLGSINALAVLGKREFSQADKKKLEHDRDWLVEKYGGPGSFSNPEDDVETIREEEAFAVVGRELNRRKRWLMNN